MRWHHVMKLAVVAKQVSIKECEPRPSAHCSWITSFTDLWQTVWDIVAAFIDPSFSQVVPPRLRNAGFQKRERPGGGASQQQTAYDNGNCNSKLISQTQIQNIKSPTISAYPDLPRVYSICCSSQVVDPTQILLIMELRTRRTRSLITPPTPTCGEQHGPGGV